VALETDHHDRGEGQPEHAVPVDPRDEVHQPAVCAVAHRGADPRRTRSRYPRTFGAAASGGAGHRLVVVCSVSRVLYRFIGPIDTLHHLRRERVVASVRMPPPTSFMISMPNGTGIRAPVDAQHIVRCGLVPQDSCCFSIHGLIIPASSGRRRARGRSGRAKNRSGARWGAKVKRHIAKDRGSPEQLRAACQRSQIPNPTRACYIVSQKFLLHSSAHERRPTRFLFWREPSLPSVRGSKTGKNGFHVTPNQSHTSAHRTGLVSNSCALGAEVVLSSRRHL